MKIGAMAGAGLTLAGHRALGQVAPARWELRKFVAPLPGVGRDGIPVAIPIKRMYGQTGAQDDFYRILMGQFRHSFTGWAPPDEDERGWKETVRMDPGQITRVIMMFELPPDPVVKAPDALNAAHNGRTYYFVTADCRAAFEKEPARRRYGPPAAPGKGHPPRVRHGGSPRRGAEGRPHRFARRPHVLLLLQALPRPVLPRSPEVPRSLTRSHEGLRRAACGLRPRHAVTLQGRKPLAASRQQACRTFVPPLQYLGTAPSRT